MDSKVLILGAGPTGLACGMVGSPLILERQPYAGGICCSYYVDPQNGNRLHGSADRASTYRFEWGGGHWLFGGSREVKEFINGLSPLTEYRRRASVFLPQLDRIIPFPIQYHLSHLPPRLAQAALTELRAGAGSVARRDETLRQWALRVFGPTLAEVFFDSFHRNYTADLWDRISPQDPYKSPFDLPRVERGMSESQGDAGYNSLFLYPQDGLGMVFMRMAERCNVEYGCDVAQIDPRKQVVISRDNRTFPYTEIISSLPLHRVLRYASIATREPAGLATSVLVVNAVVKPGPRFTNDHWVYVADAPSGLYRFGCYSNVDASFLPETLRETPGSASVYVEKAFVDSPAPAKRVLEEEAGAMIADLRRWGFVDEVLFADPHWVETAYTWLPPGTRWVEEGVTSLASAGIQQAGRYARWKFQGIAESISEGWEAARIRGFRA